MSNGNLQEWEEYDARLFDDAPIAPGALATQRSRSEFRQTSLETESDSEGPFLQGNAGETAAEMEGERARRRAAQGTPTFKSRIAAPPSGCSCNCGGSADDSFPDDGDQSSESEAWASEAVVFSGAREVDPHVKRARFMANKPVPGVPGITIEQLVDKWRVRIAPEIPLPILIAFMTYESAGFEDATHGTAKNAYTSPPFYELGLFQTPAGLHGHCSSGDYRSCEFRPPGKEDPHDPSDWHKLCQQISGGCKDWKDPETQVQVGLKNLENTATSIRGRFKDLFTDPGSDWDLRAAVLLPFAGGAGFARHFLAEYQAVSKTLDDQSWERLGQMTFVRQPGGTRYTLNSMGVWRNVNEKMALAAKLGYQPRQSSLAKEIETQLEVPDLQAARNSPAVQQLIKFENIKKYRPSEWRDALAVAQSYWSDPFLENFWKIRDAENNSSLSLAEHGGLRFSIEKKALSDLITEAAKKRILEHVTGEIAELVFGEGAGSLVGLLGFSLEFLQMARDIENERMLGKVGPEGDKWRKEQIHRFVLGILAEDIARGTDTSPGEISYNLDKQYNRFKAIADKYAEYAQLEHQLAVYGDQIPDRPPDVMKARESEVQENFAAQSAEAEDLQPAWEVDPYVSIRHALSREHQNLSAEEMARTFGRQPAAVALHSMLSAPELQQATISALLGKAGRRSVQIHHSDVPIPAYFRMLSRLCLEAAEQSEVQESAAAGPEFFIAPIGVPGPVRRAALQLTDDWNFTRSDFARLTGSGQKLTMAPDSTWFPPRLQRNLLNTLDFVFGPAISPPATEGVNARDFFHGHLVIKKDLATAAQSSKFAVLGRKVEYGSLHTARIEAFGKEVKFENQGPPPRFALTSGYPFVSDAKSTVAQKVTAYMVAVQKVQPSIAGVMEDAAKIPGAAVMYHTFETIEPADLAAKGQKLDKDSPRRNYVTPLDTNSPAQYTTPAGATYEKEFTVVIRFCFLVDKSGAVHVRPFETSPGFTSLELSTITGQPFEKASGFER